MMARMGVVLAVLLAPVALGAQQAPKDTFTLREIVVTATRVPVSRASVASTVTVLTGEELRAQGIRYVADALRSVPGAAVAQSGSFGAVTSLFLRGGQSNYVQVLVDGVAVNGPGGTFDFGSLTTDNVERIEIVAGPTSVLYGSDAVSGVVQIFTRPGRGRPGVDAALRGGTYGSLAWEAALRGAAERVSYSFAGSRFTTDGVYPFNNQDRDAVVSGRIRVAADDRTDGVLSLRYADHVFHFPTDGAGRLVDRNQFTYENGTTLGLELGRYLTSRVETRVQLASHQTDGGYDDRPDAPGDTLGFYASQSAQATQRRSVDLRTNVYLHTASVLTLGVQTAYETERDVNQSQSQFGPSSGSSDFHRLNRAYYAQALLEPVSRLSVTTGGRVDDNEAFGSFATYRMGVSYGLPAHGRVRASVGTGFKEPTFFENFATGFVTGNPNLRPERSLSWEVGVEQAAGAGRLGVTYFNQRFRDLIQYTAAPITPGGPNYLNVAGANASGLELTARMLLPGGVTLEGGYTSLHTRVTDAGFDTGPGASLVNDSSLIRRPKRMLSVRLGRSLTDRAAVSAAARYVGERSDLDFSTYPALRVALPGYAVVDVAGEFTLLRGAPRLDATLRTENLFDRRYVEIANFPARGRTVFAGGRIAF